MSSAREIVRQRARQARQAGLRSHDVRAPRGAGTTRHAADVDDACTRGLANSGNAARVQKRSVKDDRQGRPPLLDGFVERRFLPDRCVVDENIEASPALLDIRHHPGHRSVVGDIGDDSSASPLPATISSTTARPSSSDERTLTASRNPVRTGAARDPPATSRRPVTRATPPGAGAFTMQASVPEARRRRKRRAGRRRRGP